MKNFVVIFKQNFKKLWANKYFRTIFLVMVTLIPIILVDQVMKGVLFNGDKSGQLGKTTSNWGGLAFRSQFHNSTTFLDAIGKKLPTWTSLLIDYLLIILFSILIYYAKRKFIIVGLAVLLSGILGNTIDASHFGGVRNTMFIPYHDSGTFNFADLAIVVGAVLTGLGFIWDLYCDFKNDKKNKMKDKTDGKNNK